MYHRECKLSLAVTHRAAAAAAAAGATRSWPFRTSVTSGRTNRAWKQPRHSGPQASCAAAGTISGSCVGLATLRRAGTVAQRRAFSPPPSRWHYLKPPTASIKPLRSPPARERRWKSLSQPICIHRRTTGPRSPLRNAKERPECRSSVGQSPPKSCQLAKLSKIGYTRCSRLEGIFNV